MKKQIAVQLQKKAQEIATMYSNQEREKNFVGEKFSINRIIPLSEYFAVVIFNKDTGKTALAVLLWIAAGNGYWQYFFPTDSHILGMQKVADIKAKLEEENYSKNFDAHQQSEGIDKNGNM